MTATTTPTFAIPNHTQVARRCVMCQLPYYLNVPTEGLQTWKAGTLIQTALPSLDDGDRELLITGICEPCFDMLFKAPTEQ